MGKFTMPTLQQFIAKKRIYDERKDPVWVRLENDMREKQEKGIRPYNETVAVWLRFLRDLKCYFYLQARRRSRKLLKDIGPPWYCELSLMQREVLNNLKSFIHQDLLEDLPYRTRKALSDLGVTLKLSRDTLMRAMVDSIEDPGVFIWYLYKAVYKRSPSELRGTYDMNSIILMSSLVFIDLKECIQNLDEITRQEKPPPPKPKQKSSKYYEPKIRYGEYLQKMDVPLVSNHGSGKEKKPKPMPLEYKLRLRTENSYEALCQNESFLEKRKDRNRKAAQKERICRYKFWEPPSTLRNTDPKMAAYVEKLKMMKLKAKLRCHAPYTNVQYKIRGVSYVAGRPQYQIANVGLLPSGYIPINGGIVCVFGDMVTTILGYWKYPREVKEKCFTGCDCLTRWEGIVMNYLKESKCRCGHLYDYYHTGSKSKEKYFYPPSRHGPMWFDEAKIFQMDPMEDFIKDTVKDAVLSSKDTTNSSVASLSAAGVKIKDLLAAFLADLSDTALLIPHLPNACLLNNLQEWVRNRVKGKIDAKQHKQLILQSQRCWLDLKHMDFRARAYRIPFTPKEIKHMNWSHRYMIQDLFHILMEDFVSRNRVKQLEQTRLWWPTTKFDAYPSKAFLDIFFTYMPGRMKDTFLINPYSSQNTPKYGAKTCPLRI